ncbi:hypothetical protein RRG08_041959 [Elysia crispata]|uniref:G-protein coupled receptors family 1 profile domain-containing protein n=1 Tax=Elysia crispata TaxID=231223 RepID=A0AAE0XX19_9GAST|nr:hypothetical protein RRG08_041959 [Elysia crispata]
MDTIDYDAREIAWKVLIVTTIVLTLLWNAALLYKIVRAAGGVAAILTGQRGPRHQTFVSLIIGDVFVALFTMVIRARVLFENDTSLTCRSFVLADFYFQFIMPFVYGVGLVVLAVEGMMFRRRARAAHSSQSPGALVSLAISSVPWIFGIIIALPLTIAGADLDKCQVNFTLSRLRAILYVCQLLPVAMAIFFTSLNTCSTQNVSAAVANEQIPAVVSTVPQGQPGFTGIASRGPEQPTAPPMYSPYEEIDGDFSHSHPGLTTPPPTASLDQPTTHPHHTPNYTLTQHYQHPHGGQFQHAQPYSGQFQYTQPYGTQFQHAQPYQNMNAYGQPGFTHHFQAQGSHTGQPPSQVGYLPPGSITYTLNGQPSLIQPPRSLHSYYSLKENSALSVTTLAFFVCVVPFAIFQLSYTLNTDRQDLKEMSQVVISDLVFWLLATRTFVVPFFWVTTGSLRKPSSM